MELEDITGVMVQYYVTCKRELWFYCNQINMNYDNDDIVGYATIYLNNKEVGNEDIYIKKGKRNSKIKNFFQKLFKKDVD